MEVKEYIENNETKFKLMYGNLCVASNGFKTDDSFTFQTEDKINFTNLCLLKNDKESQLKIHLSLYEEINIKGLRFAICPISFDNNKISIEISFYISDNYFNTNINIKNLIERFQTHKYKEVELYKIYDKEDVGSFSISWKANYDFKQPVQYYINLIKLDFENVINFELLGNEFSWKKEYSTDELLFIKEVLIPLFNLMRYKSVRFNHGTQEFGKDITFYDLDKFGNIEYYGVQAKAGNLSGKTNSQINEITSQIEDIIKIPFKDIDSGKEQFIGKIIIAISGEFTENAKIKLLHHIPDYLKNNLRFIDKAKILTLIKEINNNTT